MSHLPLPLVSMSFTSESLNTAGCCLFGTGPENTVSPGSYIPLHEVEPLQPSVLSASRNSVSPGSHRPFRLVSMNPMWLLVPCPAVRTVPGTGSIPPIKGSPNTYFPVPFTSLTRTSPGVRVEYRPAPKAAEMIVETPLLASPGHGAYGCPGVFGLAKHALFYSGKTSP